MHRNLKNKQSGFLPKINLNKLRITSISLSIFYFIFSLKSRHFGNRHFGTVDIMGIMPNRHFGTVDIMGIDILGIDILGVDILGIDIPAPTLQNC